MKESILNLCFLVNKQCFLTHEYLKYAIVVSELLNKFFFPEILRPYVLNVLFKMKHEIRVITDTTDTRGNEAYYINKPC